MKNNEISDGFKYNIRKWIDSINKLLNIFIQKKISISKCIDYYDFIN